MTAQTSTLSVNGFEHGLQGLRMSDVSVHYRDKTAIRNLSFSLESGQWLTVIGPNGAGKSTLLKALAGVVDHDGSVELVIDGQPAEADTSRRRLSRLVAYVPQAPVLPPGMTTAEYVLVGRTSHLRWYQFESGRDRDLVTKTLIDLDLVEHAARPVAELSGGESQRVALARAIVQQAAVLALDEPTSALDLAHQLTVLELIDRLRAEYGLIVVTAMHDLTIASRFADHFLLLDHGDAAIFGPPDEVLTTSTLSDHYGVGVRVMAGPEGGVIVVPVGDPSRTISSPGAATRD